MQVPIELVGDNWGEAEFSILIEALQYDACLQVAITTTIRISGIRATHL